MINSLIVSLVDYGRRASGGIIAGVIAVSVLAGFYVASNFKINTDINQLLSADLPFRVHEKQIDQAFPQKADNIIVVIDADSADEADFAASSLAMHLKAMGDKFSYVERPEDIPFFRREGLLFLSKEDLNRSLNDLVKAQPMLATLASDPTLRGLFSTIGLMAKAAKQGAVSYDDLDRPFGALASSLELEISGHYRPISWQSLMSSAPPSPNDLRKIIITKPVLDYTELEPGKAASDALRKVARELNLTAENGVRVRLTGPVALNDEEFASVTNGTKTATIMSAVLVALILWLALRSTRLIVPIIISLAVGLILTTALALMTVHSLNLISVAFAVMFIGIAVDFGIQFGVRYRAERFREPVHAIAMKNTASLVALPLAMAAGSTALGFLSFLPTAYRGVSELGLIAGMGMIIAFVLTVTFLPALFSVFSPPPENEAVGFRWMAPVDRLIENHRFAILICAFILALGGGIICTQLRFDFDPLDLKDPKTESVSTLFDLMRNPEFSPYTIQILSPSLQDAAATAKKLEALPTVDHTMSLATFVPMEQSAKLAMIADIKSLLDPAFNPLSIQRPPTQDEVYATLNDTASALHALGPDRREAARLAKDLDDVVAHQSSELTDHLNQDIIQAILDRLAAAREALKAGPVSLETITPDLRQDWVAANGKALLEVFPKGDPRKPGVLDAFAASVEKVAPDASGPTISIRESGRTITSAFVHAGSYAIVTIMLLSLLLLRSFRDVVILVLPIILAGILTLATTVLIGLPLNFANIIALPLLLSLGVSYAIYFVTYHRAGMEKPLQSSMARAVLFSACTALVAFGSLGLSSHLGTASMGKLLTVALLYSLTCTFFVLPALLGRVKTDKHSSQ